MNVAAAVRQRENGKPLHVGDWIGTLFSDETTATNESMRTLTGIGADSGSMESRADRAQERARDIQAFDELLRRHPETLGRLKAQGIDLDAEKTREQARIRSENPRMSEEEAGTRSAIAVYMRHGEAIRNAAPDESARRELDAGLERLKPHARELAIPYVEAIRSAAGILPADRAAIVAATNGAGFDTRAVRKGDELRFESASDRVAQVWSVKHGERPEKSVEIPNGPRIRIATVPEPDATLARQRGLAIADVEAVT